MEGNYRNPAALHIRKQFDVLHSTQSHTAAKATSAS
jgi:hypothetical protein